MPNQNIFHREYFDNTLIDPLAALLLALMSVATLFAPRKYAVWPMIVIACFITQAQRVSIATLDFTFLRLMVVFAFIRIAIHGEFQGFKWNTLDKAVIVFMTVRTLFTVAGISKGGNFVSMAGESMDMIGMYFFFRCVVRDFDDLKSTMYGFILISIPIAACFIYEFTALRNPFSLFGGVSEVTRSREGKLRCMGAYSHPILAGCFWAALLPYMGAMIKQAGRIKILPILGIIASGVIIITSGSSSPVVGAGLAFVGGLMFVMRRRMRLVRWGTFLTIVFLQLVMARGVWHLLARTNIVGGSTGYYRFRLIDQFISHWKEWIISGSSRGTSTWEVPMFDIVNYYVVMGLAGGMVFLVLLIALIVFAYKNVGKAMRSTMGNTELELLAWACGVSIFVHMMTFLVVTYYGQIIMIWFLSLALTSVYNRAGALTRGFSPLMGRYHNADALTRLSAPRPVMPYPQSARMGNSY